MEWNRSASIQLELSVIFDKPFEQKQNALPRTECKWIQIGCRFRNSFVRIEIPIADEESSEKNLNDKSSWRWDRIIGSDICKTVLIYRKKACRWTKISIKYRIQIESGPMNHYDATEKVAFSHILNQLFFFLQWTCFCIHIFWIKWFYIINILAFVPMFSLLKTKVVHIII